jgi:hypothetical protein
MTKGTKITPKIKAAGLIGLAIIVVTCAVILVIL